MQPFFTLLALESKQLLQQSSIHPLLFDFLPLPGMLHIDVQTPAATSYDVPYPMMFNFAVFLGTLIAMEGVGFLAHKYVMHGWGWFLHRSHHEEHLGAFETNDIYLLALGLAAVGLIVLGNSGHDPLQWVGAGVAAFGLIYILVHDGIVHRHWPVKPRPRSRYLRRLHQAHLMHHTVKGRRNSVSFGFLYAPSVATLQKQLRQMRDAEQRRERDRGSNGSDATPINLFTGSGDRCDSIESTPNG